MGMYESMAEVLFGDECDDAPLVRLPMVVPCQQPEDRRARWCVLVDDRMTTTHATKAAARRMRSRFGGVVAPWPVRG